MNGIDVAAYGWEFSEALPSFYPAGLPVEWRLGYYANEFSAVVVPPGLWQSARAGEVAAWGREVDDGFRFYWELSQGDGAEARGLVERMRPLSALSGGVILPGEPCAELRAVLQPLALPLGCWQTQGGGETGCCEVAVVQGRLQPRQLRQQMEAMMATDGCHTGVVVCDLPDTLRQAKLVAELLGVSRSRH